MPDPAHVVGTESPRGIMVHLADTSVTLLHQATAQSGVFDLVSIWAVNVHATDDELLSIFWAGDTDPNCKIPVKCVSNAGAVEIVPGWPIERGLTIKAKAAVGAVLNIITIVTPISTYQ